MTTPGEGEPPAASDHVDALRRAVAEGRYRVDALAVADAFLRHVRMADIVERFEADDPADGDQSIEGSGMPASRD